MKKIHFFISLRFFVDKKMIFQIQVTNYNFRRGSIKYTIVNFSNKEQLIGRYIDYCKAMEVYFLIIIINYKNVLYMNIDTYNSCKVPGITN